jgi:hypothetical protein
MILTSRQTTTASAAQASALGPRRGGGCARRVGAILTTELLFILPILMMLLIGLLEIVFLINAETKVTLASREGARVAALGGSEADVLTALTAVLGANVIAYTEFEVVYPNVAQTTGNPVQVTVAVPAKVLVPFLVFGRVDPETLAIRGQTTMIIE